LLPAILIDWLLLGFSSVLKPILGGGEHHPDLAGQ
jgi:hypothetical protein